MKAICTLTQLPGGSCRLRHASAALGEVEFTGSSREEVLERMRRELQYRTELCPCTGESVGTVEIEVREAASSE